MTPQTCSLFCRSPSGGRQNAAARDSRRVMLRPSSHPSQKEWRVRRSCARPQFVRSRRSCHSVGYQVHALRACRRRPVNSIPESDVTCDIAFRTRVPAACRWGRRDCNARGQGPRPTPRPPPATASSPTGRPAGNAPTATWWRTAPAALRRYGATPPRTPDCGFTAPLRCYSVSSAPLSLGGVPLAAPDDALPRCIDDRIRPMPMTVGMLTCQAIKRYIGPQIVREATTKRT